MLAPRPPGDPPVVVPAPRSGEEARRARVLRGGLGVHADEARILTVDRVRDPTALRRRDREPRHHAGGQPPNGQGPAAAPRRAPQHPRAARPPQPMQSPPPPPPAASSAPPCARS